MLLWCHCCRLFCLTREGLVRFCTTKYEKPCSRNAVMQLHAPHQLRCQQAQHGLLVCRLDLLLLLLLLLPGSVRSRGSSTMPASGASSSCGSTWRGKVGTALAELCMTLDSSTLLTCTACLLLCHLSLVFWTLLVILVVIPVVNSPSF